MVVTMFSGELMRSRTQTLSYGYLLMRINLSHLIKDERKKNACKSELFCINKMSGRGNHKLIMPEPFGRPFLFNFTFLILRKKTE